MKYKVQFGLGITLEAPQLRHTLLTAPPTTFSDQAFFLNIFLLLTTTNQYIKHMREHEHT
jgi:hypothetical protein